MQKKLIALAVAGLGLSSAAFAQSNVTLYGTLDIGLAEVQHTLNFDPYHVVGVNPGITKTANGSATGMFNGGESPSRWGLKGSEDLGGGLSAIFVLESGINIQSGNLSNAASGLSNNLGTGSNMSADSSMSGQLFGRQAYVGFASDDWGKITFGRNVSFGYDSVIVYDPMHGSQVFSPVGFSGTYMGGGYTDDARLDSSIKYTGSYNGFNYGLLHRFGGVSGSESTGSAWQGSLGYNNGPFGIQATYMKFKDALSLSNPPTAATLGNLTATAADTTAWVLGGSYKWEAAKFYLAYEREEYTNPSDPTQDKLLTSAFGYPLVSAGGVLGAGAVNTAAFPNEKRLNVWWGGVNYDFTQALTGAVAYYHVSQNDYTAAGCPAVATSACSGTSKFTSVMLQYRFSKRTDIYGGLMHNTVDGGMAVGFLNTSNNIWGTGMRHSF